MGGNKLTVDGNTATQCASLVTTKILINSVISTPNTQFSCIDIKNMYYGLPMQDYKYMRIKYDEIPNNIKEKYNLHALQHNGWVYVQIRKGIPGLKQAGKITNDRLTKHLEQYGYIPTAQTPWLWKNCTRPVTFTLVVDDFGVKYVGIENFNHLKNALCNLYEITVNLSGSKYLGMSINWN